MGFGRFFEPTKAGHVAPAPKAPPPISRGGPPLAPKPVPRGSGSFSPAPPANPFAGAEHEAQRKVQATRPKAAPAPYIPRLPNPTPAQVQTALAIARRAQERAVGPKPSSTRVAEYHQELNANPRSREYVQTLLHYAKAQSEHQAEFLGRVTAGGGQNASSAQTAAGRAISRGDAIKLGEGVLRQGRAREIAASSQPAAPKGIGVPFLATIVPGSTVQGVDRAIATAVPDEAAKLAQIQGVGSAAAALATGAPEASKEGRGTIVQNAIADLARLPANTVNSVVQLGGAGIQAATGNPKPLEQIGSSFVQQAEHPVRTFKEHPLTTALTLAGVEEALGKGVGAVARTGIAGDTVKAAASTARPDLQLYNDMAVSRRYSSDPIRKAAEVLSDRARGALPEDSRQAAAQATGPRLRRAIHGGMFHPGEVDIAMDTGEQLRRRLRGDTMKSINAAKPAHGADAVPLIAEGIVRTPETLQADLVKERARLIDAQHGGGEPLTGKDLAANRANVAQIEGLLGDRKFLADPGPAFAAAHHYVATTGPLTDALLRVGHLEPEQLRARLFPYAQAHMGARYFSVADHQAAEAAALGQERAIAEAIKSGPARIKAAEALVSRASKADRIRSTIELANRAGNPAESDAAVAAVKRQMQAQGITDLRSVPTRVVAEKALEDLKANHGAAVEALPKARAYRAAVSGRGRPEAVLEHEDRLAASSAARGKVAEAQRTLDRVEHARSRLVGAQRTRRASDGLRAATDEERAQLQQHEAALATAKARLHTAQAEHATARDVAQRSSLPPQHAGLRYADGQFLPNEHITAHAAANGVPELGFMTHQDLGRSAFFKSTSRRPALATKRRTGASFESGTYDRSYKALVSNASDLAGSYAAHHATDQRLTRFGIGSGSKEEMSREIENFSHTPEGQRIVNSLGELELHPIGPERVRAQRNVEPGSAAAAREQFGIEQHKDVTETPQPEGQYTMLPKAVGERLKEHDALLGGTAGKKALQKFTGQWRQTMLFTSPRWLLGNPQEQGIRLAIGGAAPKFVGGRSGRFAARLVDAYDKIGQQDTPEGALARETIAQTLRGSHYSAAEQLAIVRKADQFAGSAVLGPTLRATEHSTEAGVLRAVVKPWRVWRDVVGKGMAKLEQESRQAAFGKVAAKDVHDFTGRWRNVMKMSDEAVAEYARGTLTKAKTAQLVRETDEMMGAWGHLTPTVRGAVQTWSPFGLWWLTSMRFLRRLPIDHPVKTAITAAIYNATQRTREQEPTPTPWEVGGVHIHLPLGLGGIVAQPTYYSPAGVSIEPGKTIADMVLPQVAEPLSELKGRDELTGEALTAPGRTRSGAKPNALQTAAIIANTVAEGLIPGLRQATQLRESGGKAYSTSNVISPQIKPGSQRSTEETLLKILSPLRFYWESGGPRTQGSSAAPALSPRDAVRAGLREETVQNHERSAAREAIREGLRREAVGR